MIQLNLEIAYVILLLALLIFIYCSYFKCCINSVCRIEVKSKNLNICLYLVRTGLAHHLFREN